MSTPILALATAEELRAIGERALTALEETPLWDDDPAEAKRLHVRFCAAAEALRFVAAAGAALGDASLLPLLADALDLLKHWNNDAPDHIEALCEGVTGLLEQGAEVTPVVEELATSKDKRLRQAVASGLKPKNDEAIELLEGLCTDPVSDVRRAARRRLEKVREVAWWRGKWKSDPLARLEPGERERAAPAIAALAKLLDEQSWRLPGRSEELVAHMSALPDELVVELAEQLLAATERYWNEMPAVGTLMLSRRGGEQGFLRVIERWGERASEMVHSDFLPKCVTHLAGPRRLEVCQFFLQLALRGTAAERKEQRSVPVLLADLVSHGWPPEADLSPLLDAALERQTEGWNNDWVCSELERAFERADVNLASIEDRVVEACAAGFPGKWERLAHHLLKLLNRLAPAAMRVLVERVLANVESGWALVWALEKLFTVVYDAERDPPRLELAAQLYEDPRYRATFLGNPSLRGYVLPCLRRDLRAGQLDFAGALGALHTIDSLYGGVEDAGRRSEYLTTDEGKRRAELVERLEPFLGPPELQGPPTEEEWRIYRARRDVHDFTRNHIDWLSALLVVPPGPWHPEDRRVFERAFELWRAGEDVLSYPITQALANKPTLEDLPLMDELIRRESREDKGYLKRLRWRLMERLGLDPEEDDEGEGDDDGEEDEGGEWMDEPEDDEL